MELEPSHENIFISGIPRLFPGLPTLCHSSPWRVSSQQSRLMLSLRSNPQNLSLSIQTSLSHIVIMSVWSWVCEPLLSWEVLLIMISVVYSFCFASWTHIVSLPSEILKLSTDLTCEEVSKCAENFPPFLPGYKSPSQKPFVSLFVFIFCPTSFCGDLFAFLEIWGHLLAFRCSVRVVPYADECWMYLWESLSPFAITLPSWKSPQTVFIFYLFFSVLFWLYDFHFSIFQIKNGLLDFPVIMYGCESQTIKNTEYRRIDAFKLWCWRRLWRVPGTAKRSNQSILKEINPEYSLKGLRLKLKFQYFGHLMPIVSSLEKTLMLGKI